MTSKIDEEIFKPLYTTEKGDNRVGRPNVPIRILVAMIILKEGVGCSDEQLCEYCRFNLLYRRALGMVSLDEQCPTIDSYYGFRRKLCKHEEMFKENLFDKCFKQITKQQALAFFVEDAAKTVFRTDSETMGKRLLTLGIVIDLYSHPYRFWGQIPFGTGVL